ncbi:MAG: hypothetical protein ACOYOE_04080 [Chlorobium sp.]
MTRLTIFALTLFSVLIAGLMGYKNYSESKKYYLAIEMSTSNSTAAQIFFDTGHGYNEHDSVTLNVQSGVPHKYLFRLPKATVKSIRFDPARAASIINIKKAEIETASGKKLKNFPVESFIAKSQILKMEVISDALTIYTIENANDPITEIENSSFEQKNGWIDFLAKRGWIYAGYAILSFIIFVGITKFYVKEIDRVIAHIVNYLVKKPKKAILFIGIISAIASCYPVVFFDMSFISPAGISGLYSGPPWIPGFQNDVMNKDYRGSDLGAMQWSIAPNSVVQHDALFRNLEFPFWTRFVGAGAPLFAQGQSMIGDVLHWIPVVLDGSAIGWDIKFILSKAIFAIGIGLLVFRLTNNLSSGLLIAISSCFLGFFAFRYNHPAFFVLTYSPWVVLQWDRLGQVFSFPSPRKLSCVLNGILLALITWMQLNAGPPKEGVITACFMHTLGVISFIIYILPKYGRIRTFLFASVLGFSLAMITAPHWLLFLDALGKSYTVYDTPSALTFHPWMIVCFFENFFFQIFNHNLSAPSVNLFILFGMLSAFFNLQFRQTAMTYGSWFLFAFAMATAYGFIPKAILISIPFINKIQHIGDVFSMPMMIIALIISGYGIRDYLLSSEKAKKNIILFLFITTVALCLIFSFKGKIWKDINFLIIITYVIAFIALAQLYQNIGSVSKDGRIVVLVLVSCFVMLHIRHGMHLTLGVNSIDNFIMQPSMRGDYSNKSKALEYIKKVAKAPVRVIGENDVLFPGYNSRLGLEGIVSVEPLRNDHYEKLLTILDYPDQGWGWLRLIKSKQIQSRAASLDMLNIGYIVSMPGTKMPQGMKLVYTDDLDVWERESVWPRAFFVNTIKEERKPSDLLDALEDRLQQPFAAIQGHYMTKSIQNKNSSYVVIPAKEYKLTNNSTSFSVEANGPGIIVLNETYYPKDFIALLNGNIVEYIRVNEAFKGLLIDKAGSYNVSFTYRPEKLNQSLLLCFFGFWLLLFLMIYNAVKVPVRI